MLAINKIAFLNAFTYLQPSDTQLVYLFIHIETRLGFNVSF